MGLTENRRFESAHEAELARVRLSSSDAQLLSTPRPGSCRQGVLLWALP
jgi:hypothetical protein